MMKKNKKVMGFTAIELLVAVSLFVILIGIAAGGFVRALRTQRAIVSLMEVNDNVSFALEQMTREFRTGSNFSLPSASEVQFTNTQREIISYRLNEGALERGSGSGRNKVYKIITAPSIEVLRFSVELKGQNPGDGFPPRITISLSASAKNKYLEGVTTDLETTVSSRITDT